MRRTALLLSLSLSLSCWAQTPDPAKERAAAIHAGYGKYEFRVPTRDGKRLFTSVYVPNGVHFGKKYPILLMRTPYSVGPYGPDRYRDSLAPIADYEKDGLSLLSRTCAGAGCRRANSSICDPAWTERA